MTRDGSQCHKKNIFMPTDVKMKHPVEERKLIIR